MAERSAPWVRVAGLAVVLVAVAARAVVMRQAVETVYFANPILDARTNWETARAWAFGDGPPRPFFKAPLYPWTLGHVLSAIHRAGLSDHDAQVTTAVLQHAIGVALAWVAWRLAATLAGAVAGLVAGLAMALCGAMIFFEQELLDAALVSALLLGGLALLAIRPPPIGWTRLLLGGLLLGLAVVARPTCALAAVAAAAWCLWVHHERAGAWQWGPARGAVLLAPTVILVALVCWANHGQALIATYGGPNFWLANHAGADGFSTSVPQEYGSPRAGEDYIERFAQREAAARLGHEATPAEADHLWWGEGLRFWREEPLAALVAAGRRALLFWQGPEIKNNKSLPFVGQQITALGFLMRAVNWFWLAPLGIAGLWVGRRWPPNGRNAGVTLLGLAVLATFAAGLPFPVNSRYRLPALPLLCVGAGIAVAFLADAVRGARWTRTLVTAGWIAGLALAFSLDWTGVDRTDTHRDWWQLGNLAQQVNNWTVAERAYTEALRQHPDHLESRVNLAQVWLQTGNGHRAAAALEDVVADTPDYPVAWALLGQAHELNGEPVSAERAFREALRLEPDSVPALQGFVYFLLSGGRMGEAGPLAEHLVELAPNDPLSWAAAAQTRSASGDTAGSEAALARARALGGAPR